MWNTLGQGAASAFDRMDMKMTEIANVQPSTDTRVSYSSLKGNDLDTRKAVFKAMASAVPLQDNLDKPIAVRHVVRVPRESVNEITGELDEYMATYFITESGETFTAASKGIDNSWNTILAIFGDPAGWGEAIEFVGRREGKGTQKYLKLDLA